MLSAARAATSTGWLLTLAALLAAACGGSELDPTSEATLPAATATAVASSSTTPDPAASSATPTGIATVTVAVPSGPQTQRLLLVQYTALVVREINGTQHEVAQLAEEAGVPAFPAWSPNGETIAFVARRFFAGDPDADWGDDIYVVPATGGDPRLVRPHADRGQQVFGLSWQPGSDELWFGRIELELRAGVPTQVAGATVVALNLESGAERDVIESAYDPSLSADGRRLAYVALGELPTQTSVVAAEADGSAPVVLAEVGQFEVVRLPRISPDGETVVFTAAAPLVRSSEPARGRLAGWLQALLAPFAPGRAAAHGIPMDLWLAESRSGAITRLTAIGEDDPYPAWSSDGETVVFIGTNGLYEVSVPAGELARTGDGRFDGQVAVSPSE